MPRSLPLFLALLLVPAFVFGCAGDPRKSPYARPYPKVLIQDETLDVQVQKSETHIELTNTTARPFGFGTLWLNQRYSRPITSFAVGETLRIPLREFRDEFHDPFPAGGFWATGPADILVQAQLEYVEPELGETKLYGLVVVTDIETE